MNRLPLRLAAATLWLLAPTLAFADIAPGPQDLCGCSVLGVLPLPIGAVLLALSATRRARALDP
ncbi:MAG: hypothetical protein R3F61_07835 [Myxococcota bacterium]